MIGDEIRAAREQRSLSHEALEERIKQADVRDESGLPIRVSHAAIWRIEQGMHNPNFRTLLALAVGLKVTFVINSKGVTVR